MAQDKGSGEVKGKIKIRVDLDRMMEHLTVDDMVSLEERSTRGMRNALALFVVDAQDNYLPVDKATKLIGSLTIREMGALVPVLLEAAKGAAGVPPLPESESTTSTGTESGEGAPVG